MCAALVGSTVLCEYRESTAGRAPPVDDVASARLLSVGFLCHVPVRTGEAVPASASTAPTACSPAIARFSLVLVWQPFGHGAAAGRRFLHVRARGTVGSRGQRTARAIVCRQRHCSIRSRARQRSTPCQSLRPLPGSATSTTPRKHTQTRARGHARTHTRLHACLTSFACAHRLQPSSIGARG